MRVVKALYHWAWPRRCASRCSALAFPGTDGFQVFPVRHRDADLVTCRLDPQEPRLLRRQFDHALSHGAIAMVTLGARVGEDDGVVRRGWGLGDQGHGKPFIPVQNLSCLDAKPQTVQAYGKASNDDTGDFEPESDGGELGHAQRQPLGAVARKVDMGAGVGTHTFEREHGAFAELVVEDFLAFFKAGLSPSALARHLGQLFSAKLHASPRGICGSSS